MNSITISRDFFDPPLRPEKITVVELRVGDRVVGPRFGEPFREPTAVEIHAALFPPWWRRLFAGMKAQRAEKRQRATDPRTTNAPFS